MTDDDDPPAGQGGNREAFRARSVTDRPAYSRVYASIVDDPKFAHVYDDDRALATWLRLLLVADQAWPSSALIPANTRRQSLDVLIGAGLVDLGTGGRYRIRGLEAERKRRAAEQRNGGVVRAETAQRGEGGRFLPGNVQRSSPPLEPPLVPSTGDQQNQLIRDETRRDETREDARGPLLDAIAYVEERTRRPWVFGPGSKVWDALEPDVRDFGWPAVKVAMEAEKAPFPDAGQLVFGASRRLHPISGPEKQAELDPEYVKRAVAAQRKAKNGA